MDSQGRPTNPAPQPAPTKKFQLEENVRVSAFWLAALKRGQFAGSDATAVAGLLGFLTDQHDRSLSEYEAESVKHPEWGRPKSLETAGVA